jgi:spermidine synthase
VIQVARTELTYLADSKATINVVLGDARLSLEREPKQNFDVLVVDAFTSDVIPVHLLTREAFRLYFLHLKKSGVLAVHVSSRYLDLAPVVHLAAAESMGKHATLVEISRRKRSPHFAGGLGSGRPARVSQSSADPKCRHQDQGPPSRSNVD